MRWVSIAAIAFLFSCHAGQAAWAGDRDRDHDDYWFYSTLRRHQEEQQQKVDDWRAAQQHEFDRMDAEDRHQQIMRKLEELKNQ